MRCRRSCRGRSSSRAGWWWSCSWRTRRPHGGSWTVGEKERKCRVTSCGGGEGGSVGWSRSQSQSIPSTERREEERDKSITQTQMIRTAGRRGRGDQEREKKTIVAEKERGDKNSFFFCLRVASRQEKEKKMGKCSGFFFSNLCGVTRKCENIRGRDTVTPLLSTLSTTTTSSSLPSFFCLTRSLEDGGGRAN